MITASIMLATIMQGVDNTIANVALPHIQGSLSAAQDQIAWVLTSYIVAVASGADADQPAGAARPSGRDLGHRRDAGADLWSDAGRLADRGLQLALDLLHQPDGRADRVPRHPDLYSR